MRPKDFDHLYWWSFFTFALYVNVTGNLFHIKQKNWSKNKYLETQDISEIIINYFSIRVRSFKVKYKTKALVYYPGDREVNTARPRLDILS